MKNPRLTITQTFDIEITLEKILPWIQSFNPAVILNSNNDKQLQNDKYHTFDFLLAIGEVLHFFEENNLFNKLNDSHSKLNDWLVGYISYDVKNQIENLHSKNNDGLLAPDNFFFRPRYVIEFTGRDLKVHYLPEFDSESDIHSLINSLINHAPVKNQPANEINIVSRVNKVDYIENVNAIKKHIRRGDIYEMNYCIEFYSENALIDPPSVYSRLNTLSPMPFSTYFHINNLFLMCASPERFLAKRKNKIISQPIKGTAKRGQNEKEDMLIIDLLKNDQKEQAENVMIVDLVRNDLSLTAARRSVIVEELFAIKSFHQLHQMQSTISSELKKGIPFTEAIKYAFPMGSMTGAPKIRAMELIEEFEKTKRGIYSGTVGYITPDGDFDFNVVIRSIIYNSEKHYLSFMAGSAITDGSNAEREYDECLLKMAAIIKVLDTKY